MPIDRLVAQSATTVAGAFSVKNAAFTTAQIASNATYYAYASGMAYLATAQGQQILDAATEFVDGAWGPEGEAPAATPAGLGGLAYGSREDLEDAVNGAAGHP